MPHKLWLLHKYRVTNHCVVTWVYLSLPPFILIPHHGLTALSESRSKPQIVLLLSSIQLGKHHWYLPVRVRVIILCDVVVSLLNLNNFNHMGMHYFLYFLYWALFLNCMYDLSVSTVETNKNTLKRHLSGSGVAINMGLYSQVSKFDIT